MCTSGNKFLVSSFSFPERCMKSTHLQEVSVYLLEPKPCSYILGVSNLHINGTIILSISFLTNARFLVPWSAFSYVCFRARGRKLEISRNIPGHFRKFIPLLSYYLLSIKTPGKVLVSIQK